ncbi:MAG TPA: hypothetical protein VF736_14850, partial [Pyrinomonadaceae bacterium]
MKRVLSGAAPLALALLTSAASAQQVASVRADAPGRRPAASSSAGGARLLKRMTMTVTESAEGTRVRITSDAALGGYETFTEG